jgi:outer membrane receptor protein involved in Fe transport
MRPARHVRLVCPVTVLALGLFASLFPSRVQAQQATPPEGVVRGVVVADDGKPMAAAAVVVRGVGADSLVQRGALTSADGRFRIGGFAPGRYRVVVAYVGHLSGSVPVSLTSAAPDVDVGSIRMATAPVALKAIVVSAERSSVVILPDRTSYSTKNMPVASAGTATDVLRGIPELEVDMDGKVSLRGSSNVAIHLNGRPAPMKGDALQQFLQQFPANRIDRVEVIPNPSAKYDPEGAGIVNIVLKDRADLGLSGNVSGNSGTSGRDGLNTRLAWQQGRWTIFGGTGYSFWHNQSSSHLLRENLLAQPITFLDQTQSSTSRATFRPADVSAEYKLSKTATLYGAANLWRAGSGSDGLAGYLWMDSIQAPTSRYTRLTAGRNGNTSTDFNVGVRRVVQPERDEWSVELRRDGRVGDNDGRFHQQPLTLEGDPSDPMSLTLNTVASDNAEWVLQADWTHPVGAAGKLETGYRGSDRTQSSDYLLQFFTAVDSLDPSQVTRSAYSFDERFNSAYATVSRSLGKLLLQGGLRGEAARTTFRLTSTGQAFPDDYTSAFPSANISYDLGSGRTVRLSYSKRIDRPSADLLNPAVPSADPLNRNEGNPLLKPRYSHSLSMDLSWTGSHGTLRLSPYFRRTVDNWDQVRTVDSAGVSTMTWQNVASMDNYGSNLTASLRPGGRIDGFATINAFHVAYDATNLSAGFNRQATLLSANANLTARLTSTLVTQWMATYTPARELPQGHQGAMFMSNVGAKQKLRGNKAWATLWIQDPLNLWHESFATRDATHVQTSRYQYSVRAATLSITYSFGRPPQSARKNNPDNQPAQQPDAVMH